MATSPSRAHAIYHARATWNTLWSRTAWPGGKQEQDHGKRSGLNGAVFRTSFDGSGSAVFLPFLILFIFCVRSPDLSKILAQRSESAGLNLGVKHGRVDFLLVDDCLRLVATRTVELGGACSVLAPSPFSSGIADKDVLLASPPVSSPAMPAILRRPLRDRLPFDRSYSVHSELRA